MCFLFCSSLITANTFRLYSQVDIKHKSNKFSEQFESVYLCTSPSIIANNVYKITKCFDQDLKKGASYFSLHIHHIFPYIFIIFL